MKSASLLSVSRTLVYLSLLLAATPGVRGEDLSTSSGAQLYRQYCASCHGAAAEGDGPVAKFFRLSPPDLTRIARRSGGNFPTERVHRIIDGRQSLPPHGTREMPVWGLQFAMTTADPAAGQVAADDSIARLVEYLRTLQKN